MSSATWFSRRWLSWSASLSSRRSATTSPKRFPILSVRRSARRLSTTTALRCLFILFLRVLHRFFSFRSRSKFLSFFAKGRGSMTNPSFFREDRLPYIVQRFTIFPSPAGVQKRRRKKAKKDRYSIQSNQRKRLTQYLSQGGGEVNSNNKQKKIQTLFARDVEMESSRSSQRLFMCRYLPEI